ncbi:hypothetical protein GCM10009809_21050 [Isoptericola hypogeus]|uniref:Uncharacterized protein n=1 Tax=Isoptericola hypogeus TaxID=300179 RepID=A0ABN2JFA3_9MICO
MATTCSPGSNPWPAKVSTRPATAVAWSTPTVALPGSSTFASSGSAPADVPEPAASSWPAAATSSGAADPPVSAEVPSSPVAPPVAGGAPPNVTGVKVSLAAFATPCAPMVMTPHCTCVQSTSTVAPDRSCVRNRAPGTTRRADQVPSAAIVPPFASDAVLDPG